jgi:hypothetical protein
LKETAKVTSGNKKKLEREKAQIPEPTPQSSRVEIWAGQQKQTPEFTTQGLKIKSNQHRRNRCPGLQPVLRLRKGKLFEETPTPVSKSKKVSLAHTKDHQKHGQTSDSSKYTFSSRRTHGYSKFSRKRKWLWGYNNK